MMPNRITRDPHSDGQPSIAKPGSRTMRVDPGSGLRKARHKRSHRERAAARTRRAR
jgi:hypothetical protein